jgi:hypothetical protein
MKENEKCKVHLTCALEQATEGPDIWLNIISGYICEAFLGEISI